MKRKFTGIFALASLLLLGCEKMDPLEPNGFEEYQNEAVIVSYNKLGICSGGYVINIMGENQDSEIYYTVNLPEYLGVTTASVFPIKVVLNWERDTTYCPQSNYILIKKIKKLD